MVIEAIPFRGRKPFRGGHESKRRFEREGSTFFDGVLGNLLKLVALSAYPVAFFFPALRPNSWIRIGDTNTDLDQAIYEVVGLKSMRFPWSQNTALNYPYGEEFWKIPGHITQSVQWLAMWVLSRLFDPVLTVELWFFLGFVTTGIVTYLIARELGVSRPLSLVSSILVQALPWMTVKAMSHTSFVFVSIPLLTIYGILKLKQPSPRLLLLLMSYQISLAFFDTYWFVFSGVLLMVGLLTQRHSVLAIVRSLSSAWLIRLCVGLGVAVVALVLMARWGIQMISEGAPTRPPNPRGVYDQDEIKKWSGEITDYLVPSHGHLVFSNDSYIPGESDRVFYGGLGIQLLALLGAVYVIVRRCSPQVRLLLGLSAVSILLSVYSFPIGLLEIPTPIRWLSRVTPGIRVFVRFSAIAQALMCIVAMWFIQQLWNTSKNSIHRSLLALVVAISFLDLGPLLYRPTFTQYTKYAEIREVLDQDPEAAVLIPDGSMHPFELSMETLPGAINTKLLNTYSNLWKVNSYPHMYDSDSLATFLSERKVSYIVAAVDESGRGYVAGAIQDAVRFATSLNSPYFERIGEIIKNQNQIPIALFKVHEKRAVVECTTCHLAQWLITPQYLVESAFEYGEDVNNPLWITSRRASISAEPIPGVSDRTARSFIVDFDIHLYPGSNDTAISINSEQDSLQLDLQAGKVRNVRIPVLPSDTLTISVPSCFVPSEFDSSSSNSNEYCFGISRFKVLQVE